MDEDWSLGGKDCLISVVAPRLRLDLTGSIKDEPLDEFDYLGSSAGSPSSSLSSPDMKDQLGVDLSFCVPFQSNPFLNSPASSSGSPFGMVFPPSSCNCGPSPLPPVSHFSQTQMNVQMHDPTCVPAAIGAFPNDISLFDDDRSPSPPSDRGSPGIERIPSMLNMVYDTMPDSFGQGHQSMNSLAAAQQQLKTRSKMHEMAVKQRLITDQSFQDPRSQGLVQLSNEERRTLIQEGYPVPTRLPLTKSEEEALKIVRRKIKNKLSAQESRRKRKEYMDTLEQRCQGYYNENTQLKSRLRAMEMANKNLQNQLKRLQEIGVAPE